MTASGDNVSLRSDENNISYNSVNLLKINELYTKMGEFYTMCLSLLGQNTTDWVA